MIHFANKNSLKVFAGTSHPKLAKEIARYLKLGMGKMVIKKFANGEIYAKPDESVRGCDVFIVQTGGAVVNESMMELFIMLDAFKLAHFCNPKHN